MAETKQENKMGVMPVNKLLISMALPMIISMLVQALYNIVDSIFVSRICEDALTAVSLAFPVQNLMIAISSGTGVGVNALLSRSLGAKNQEAADKAAKNGIFLAICSYLVFLILGLTACNLFFRTQTDSATIIAYGDTYLSICMICSFGMFIQMMFERLLQATGRTIYTMFTQGTGAIINIILDPILIFGMFGLPKLGIAGAAVATVAGQIIASVMAVFFNFKFNTDVSLKGRFRPSGHIIGQIYSVGIPSILMMSISSVMVYGMNRILIAFTSTATAVFGVYFKLQSFIFMPIFGMNNGMVPIIAYNYGACKPDRIKKTIALAMVYAECIMLIGLLVFKLKPDLLLSFFNASPEMLAIGEPALRTISWSFLVAGICIISSSTFQALGNGLYSLAISFGRQLVVLLPAAYLLSLTGNIHAVWWSFPIAEVASLALSLTFMYKINQKIFIPLRKMQRESEN
ncbi:MATE family efflux transporter [Butyricicoccus porcorum]|uniref:MATE family efflux transporter n=1 Tax=Butyricicoccus porcorum TaxID=1945634 RepID=A0A252F5G8_9FIRM|nr:MATE family efflux transporter [Butyricicoccus porcorum]MCI6927226.1 MATE family efflux transporter [Butyricicoccus porcorum]MDD6986789.1 MATE family efflux transporter [Butyricicoccus porcorum]MDY4483341.1 MATE family efflux transporter [Butyricicoccus porcorum]OUM21004.1 MATE family efflux transporter [Butyricicoccus porcorum]